MDRSDGFDSLFRIAIILAEFSGVLLYYGVGKRELFKLAHTLAARTNWLPNRPLFDKILVLELIFAAVSHLAFIIAVCIGLNESAFVIEKLKPMDFTTCVGGILVGIAGMLATATIARIATLTFELLRNDGPPIDWILMSRSGWFRHHLAAFRVLPLYASVSASSIQVACEEIFFRGILVGVGYKYLGESAIVTSSVLFIVMQAFHMPRLINAMFPMIGAIVMVISFIPLYAATNSLTPCIVAHLAFFYSGIAAGKAQQKR